MKYIIALLASSLLLIGAPAEAKVPNPVHTFGSGTVLVEKGDHKVNKRKVVYAEHIPQGDRLYIELNNGSVWRFTACTVEDGRNCYWIGQCMGNGVGKSFIDIRGKAIYFPKRYQRTC